MTEQQTEASERFFPRGALVVALMPNGKPHIYCYRPDAGVAPSFLTPFLHASVAVLRAGPPDAGAK